MLYIIECCSLIVNAAILLPVVTVPSGIDHFSLCLGSAPVVRLNRFTPMGVGRIFSRVGPLGNFFQNFSRGAKSGDIWFLRLEIEKATFFAETFKIQGGLAPTSDAHVHTGSYKSSHRIL